MPLTVGQRLGSYEIVSSLGAGGMGEVYRARDSRLQRDVAIKVLPELFALEADRLARFAREAQMLAALNHPHIASIYGLEDSDGVPALVMELVEGPTLADLIETASTSSRARASGSTQVAGALADASGKSGTAGHGLALDEALPIARQLALALEAAHEQGIVHRDLKPANIKVRPDGTVKVLDFGLAKALQSDLAQAEVAHSPTLTNRATQFGVILGTAAYMAPEQARGKPVDRRADVWAFGAVLYEMLTGRRAFPGAEISDILARVIEREPDWSALPPGTPTAIVKLLHRCLEKNRTQRLHDMGDARLEIDDAMAEPPTPSVAPVAVLVPRRGWRSVAMLVALLVVAAATGWFARRPVAAPPGPVVRFTVGAPASAEFDRRILDFPGAVLSPDGSRVALVLREGNSSKIFLRRIDRLEAVPLAGTEEGQNPFFSPNGRWLAFTAGRKLKKVSVEGGTPLVLCDADWGGGAWVNDDTIVYTPSYQSGLWRVPASGGTPVKLTDPDAAQHELGHFWPQVLPGGRHLLFTSFSTPIDRSRISVYSFDTGKVQPVIEGGSFASYLQTGHVLYMRAESMVAVPFDLETLRVTGAAVSVIDDVLIEPSNGVAQISVASNGTMAYLPASLGDAPTQLVWVDRTGAAGPITATRRLYFDPALSRSGRRLAVTVADESRDVWVLDLDRDVFTRITSGAASEFAPFWGSGDNRLVFASEQPVFHVFTKALSTTAIEQPLVVGPNDSVPTSISADGAIIVYNVSHPVTGADISAIGLSAGDKPRVVVQSKFEERNGALSADGRWLAYESNDSGRTEVYVQGFPTADERWQVSTDGGSSPRWSRDGRELFFQHPDRFTAVPIVPGPSFSFGKPVVLFEGRDRGIIPVGYDVAPDGQRFVMVQRDPNAPKMLVSVTLNWFDELRAKVSK